MLIAAVPAGANKPYAYRGNHFMRSGAATVVMPDETQLSLVLERAHGLARPTSTYLMARIHGTRTCSPVSTVGALSNNSGQGHCEWCGSAQMQGSVAPSSHPPVRR